MRATVQAIRVEGSDYTLARQHPDVYVDDNDDDWLLPLAKVNILVGANNSGKSRLLRWLYNALDDGERTLSGTGDYLAFRRHDASHREVFDKDKTEILRLAPRVNGNEPGVGVFATPSVQIKEIEALPKRLENLQRAYRQVLGRNPSAVVRPALEDLEEQVVAMRKAIAGIRKGKYESRFVYVPVLRGLRPIGAGEARLERTKKDYELARSDNHFIWTGESLYDDIRSRLLGERPGRQSVVDLQEWLSESFFRGRETTLIPREGSDVLYLQVGEDERAIYDYGDGFQQLLILVSPLFLFRDKPLVAFIEEPELFMHPGLERRLIEALTREQSAWRNNMPLQVFCATHSTQFLDQTFETDDISVFHVRRSDGGDVYTGATELASTPTFSISMRTGRAFEVLRDLGTRNSSVLLANCTVWVEGITDRMYIRHWISLLAKEELGWIPVDNLHFAIAEYGGSNIDHLADLEDDGIDISALCGPALVIADQDDPKTKLERRKRLKITFGDNYLELCVREIENTLTPAVLKRVVEDFEGGTDRGLGVLKQKDYATKLLGDFIDSRIDVSQSKRRRSSSTAYADVRGSIKNKVLFAEKAVKAMNDVGDLSDEAQRITKAVLNHIARHNE